MYKFAIVKGTNCYKSAVESTVTHSTSSKCLLGSQLKEDKTQVIWLGTRQQLGKITAQSLTLPNATVQFTNNFNDLDVLLESADHGRPHICTQQVLLLSAPSAQVDQTVTDAGGDEDTCSCICQQPTRLLQQYVSWC